MKFWNTLTRSQKFHLYGIASITLTLGYFSRKKIV